MAWDEALERFETHLQAAGKSKHTIAAFGRDLRCLAEAVQVDPECVKREDLEAAITQQEVLPDGRPRSPHGMNRFRTAVRSFYGWMLDTGLIEVNPAASLRTVNVHQKPPVYLTDQEERTLLRCLRDQAHQRHAIRDNAIILLLLDTGLRVGELVGLNIDDVDGKHLRIHRAKGGSPIVKFLPARTRKAIDTYLRKERSSAEYQDALFLNQQGGRLQARAVQMLVPRWVQRTGIAKQVTPHTLRHTFATSLLNRTGNLLLVQKALGHSNVTTTQIYAHVADSVLESAVESRTAPQQ